MKHSLVALAVGFIFALGLGISGMTQPQKVIGFLDIFGKWDPSLIFVMLGAIAVHFVAYKIIRKRKAPYYSAVWHVPTKNELTPALVIGSVLFGIGWGIGGLCPGPAITSLASFNTNIFIFIISMLAGMLLFSVFDKFIKFRK